MSTKNNWRRKASALESKVSVNSFDAAWYAESCKLRAIRRFASIYFLNLSEHLNQKPAPHGIIRRR